MTTYQFVFKSPAIDLVIDVDAETPDGAVERVRRFVGEESESDEPLVMADGEVYARAWFNLKPAEIGAEHITESWEATRE